MNLKKVLVVVDKNKLLEGTLKRREAAEVRETSNGTFGMHDEDGFFVGYTDEEIITADTPFIFAKKLDNNTVKVVTNHNSFVIHPNDNDEYMIGKIDIEEVIAIASTVPQKFIAISDGCFLYDGAGIPINRGDEIVTVEVEQTIYINGTEYRIDNLPMSTEEEIEKLLCDVRVVKCNY